MGAVVVDDQMQAKTACKLGVRVHFLSFFDTSGLAAPRIVASRHKDAGNPEDHDADDNLSW
jgi:hypothetical protein